MPQLKSYEMKSERLRPIPISPLASILCCYHHLQRVMEVAVQEKEAAVTTGAEIQGSTSQNYMNKGSR